MAKKTIEKKRRVPVSSRVVSRTPEREKALTGVSIIGPITPMPDSMLAQPLSSWRGDIGTPYSSHAWVHACVKSLAQNIAGVPLKMQHGSKDDPTEIDDESKGKQLELWNLFQKPNPYLTSYQLFEFTVAYLNLDGISHWILERNNITELPKAMYVEGRNRMRPIFDGGQLVGWIFHDYLSGTMVPLDLSQVLTFKFFNPYDPYDGLSPLEAARRGISFDILAAGYGLGFFQNGAQPGGLLSTEKRMTKQQAAEMIELWETRHLGSHNVNRVAMLHSGTKYQTITISQKDMEFIEQRKWTRDEILAVFKVPKTELSLYEEVNYSNAQAQDRAYWTKTLIPIAKNIEAVINSDFVPGITPIIGKGLKIFFDFDTIPALQDTLSEKIQNAERLYRIGTPLSAINKLLKLGLPRFEWDELWFPNASVASILDIMSGKVREQPSGPSNSSTPQDDSDNAKNPDEGPSTDDEDSPDTENEKSFKRSAPFTLNTRQTSPPKKVIPHGAARFYPAFKDVEATIRPLLKGYLWRLRTHQLAKTMREGTIFDKDAWDVKLSGRLLPALLPVSGICKQVFKCEIPENYAYLKLSFDLNSVIQNLLKPIIEDKTLNGSKLDVLREAFCKLSDPVTVAKLSKLVLLATISNLLVEFRSA